MAERRMFAKTIVTSDAFLDMPPTARCLYFTLGMFADDDGFVNNPKSIMRQSGASIDDMNILIAKRFVLTFESGVIVIKHWRIHNYIRGDRKHDTKYAEELSSLNIDENGAYSLADGNPPLLENSDAKTMRQKAYEESDLPYSFDYKMRNAFYGKPCPVCGVTMSSSYLCKPTIQHNAPISMGGKHELGNISVICQSCNASIQDEPTGDLNAEEVIAVWDELCQSDVRQLTTNGIPRLGKDNIGKDSIGKVSKKFTPPTIEDVESYIIEKGYRIDAQKFIDYYTSNGWKVGKNPMKDWKAAVRNWARNDYDKGNSNAKGSGNPWWDALQKGGF